MLPNHLFQWLILEHALFPLYAALKIDVDVIFQFGSRPFRYDTLVRWITTEDNSVI